MANSLDMSLDDLIKTRSSSERWRGRGRSRQGRGRGRGHGGTFNRGRGMGMLRRGPLRVNAQPSVNVIAKPSSRTNVVSWQHDLFQDSLVAAGYTGTKLYVSNLDYGVTNEDIKELFSEVGELKRYTLHYDRDGLSSGTAEVVFTRRTDALAAMKRYNNVQLDGKAMKIEIIGAGVGMPISAELGMPVSARVNVIGGSNGRGRRAVVMMSGVGRARGSSLLNRGSGGRGRGSFLRGRGHGHGRARGQGRGRGWGRKQPSEKSADDLDKELEGYHADTMNTS